MSTFAFRYEHCILCFHEYQTPTCCAHMAVLTRKLKISDVVCSPLTVGLSEICETRLLISSLKLGLLIVTSRVSISL